MPIHRTYMCSDCAHRMEVTLLADQWDAPPPSCEACDAREMNQEFKPPSIGGSHMSRAAAITESIIANDYGVSNITFDGKGGQNKVAYKDQSSTLVGSGAWAGQRAMLEQAISIGKSNRREFGADGLDILKKNLANGTQPDLIEASKKCSIKVW